MLEFKPGTGPTTTTSSSETGPLPHLPRLRAHSRSSSLSSSPTRLSCSRGSPGVTSDGFEPQADEVLRPSALHLVERIFAHLMKLRKKAFLVSSCFPLDACGAGRDVEGAWGVRSCSSDAGVDVERGYDSDEHLGFVGVETPTSSSSSSSSSSSRASTTAESQAKSSSPHKPGSQMMANLLLSLLEDETSRFPLFEDGDEDRPFNGPRESAWHQAEDEILTDQEWRMRRYGQGQAKSSGTKKLQSSPGSKYLAMAEFSAKLPPIMASPIKLSWRRETSSKHIM